MIINTFSILYILTLNNRLNNNPNNFTDHLKKLTWYT